MDEVMNSMQPWEAPSPEDKIKTLSDKLLAAEQQVIHLKMEIEKLTTKSASQTEGVGSSPQTYRSQKLALLHSQMYQEHHLLGDYGELSVEHNDQQLPTEISPEEFVDLEEFLLDEGERAFVGAGLNNLAQCDPDDVADPERCVVCGNKLFSRGAANYKDYTCSKCEQESGANPDLRGITIPRTLRGGKEQVHRLHKYTSDPFERFQSSTSDGQMSDIEHCTFCDSRLPPGGGPSHMSSCPEYQRWSGAGSNDSFFYQPSSSHGTPVKGRRQESPLMFDVKFSAD